MQSVAEDTVANGFRTRQTRSPNPSYNLDTHLASRSCQRTVSCNERSVQRLGKSQVSGVISRQSVPQLPNAGEQDEMWIAGERKIEEIGDRFGSPFSGDNGRAHVAAQNLRDFQVDEVRGMQRLVGGKDEAAHTRSFGRLEKNLKDRGSVDDDQRLFLSARTAAAGAGRGRTGWRLASRLRISSSVGRSRAWRSSRSR
jgi:hypothetical protein